MATVKGDVHDIGKNIVGVVLQCNNYEVIDLGVMVPCDEILRRRPGRKRRHYRPSGLITPSLDEMVHVASEMQRLDFQVPLMIGGATTSKAHTAVKIEPLYQRRRGLRTRRIAQRVGCLQLLGDGKRPSLASVARNTRGARAHEQAQAAGARLSYADAHWQNRAKLDWDELQPPKPTFTGARHRRHPLADLVDTIDWTPFFITWELAGKYPRILEDEVVGEQARELFAMPRPCWTDRRGKLARPPGGARLLAGPRERRGHRPG
jgi:5-methyltetrahydrofolate--homocysteine methyltransferase